MFIFVGCAGGGTSSMFCQRIAQAINETDPNLRAAFADVQTVLGDPTMAIGKCDLMFAYGSIDAVRAYSAFDFGQLFDVIMVAPQVRYLTGKKQEIMARFPTVVEDIPSKVFGTMDGRKAFAELRGELINLDWRRGYQSSSQQSGKYGDKDVEILVINADHRNRQLTTLFEQWRQDQGICVLTESYTLEGLYRFEPHEDFEFRWLFGAVQQLVPADFVRISRRIDGLIVFSDRPADALPKLRQQFRQAGVLTTAIDARLLMRHGDLKQLDEQLMAFCQDVALSHRSHVGAGAVAACPSKTEAEETNALGIYDLQWVRNHQTTTQNKQRQIKKQRSENLCFYVGLVKL